MIAPGPTTPSERRRIAVIGIGVVGARTVRQLLASRNTDVIALSSRPETVGHRCGLSPGHNVAVLARHEHPTVDVAILCGPAASQPDLARMYLAAGSHVVAINDDLTTTRQMIDDIHFLALERQRSLVMGAGFAPGITCALAAHASRQLGVLTEIHVAKHGTGGPACARQHHRALRTTSFEVRSGEIERRPGGSGRELVWFPAPIDGADCYRAELADPVLLARSFPTMQRATARVAANRRDRFTSWLPALLPPHAEGGIGAVRVEARGLDTDGEPTTIVLGAVARPATAAAATAATAASVLMSDDDQSPPRPADERRKPREPGDAVRGGAISIGDLAQRRAILPQLRRRGVSIETFVGSASE